MQRLLHIVDLISEWTGKIVSYAILFIVAVTTYDVFARYAFNRPTNWGFDAALVFFIIFSTIGGAYVLRYDGHIRVDLFYARWSPKTKAIFDLVTSVLFFAFAYVILWKGLEMAKVSLQTREVYWGDWPYPVIITKGAVVLGAILILLQGLAIFVRNLLTILKKEPTHNAGVVTGEVAK